MSFAFPCRRALLAALLAMTCGAVIAAQPVRYALDPVHTRVMFAVEHAGFSKAIGTVSGSTGTLLFDADDWTSAKLEVSVPMRRIDLGDEKWNKAALANNLLDGDDHPTATFVSTRIDPVDAQHASVYGTLTLHGVSNEVKLDVTLNALKRHPLPPFRRTAGFSASTTISRKAFGIDAWPSVIGDRVELRIEAEATRAGRAEDDQKPAKSTTVIPATGTPAPDTVHDDATEPEPTP